MAERSGEKYYSHVTVYPNRKIGVFLQTSEVTGIPFHCELLEGPGGMYDEEERNYDGRPGQVKIRTIPPGYGRYRVLIGGSPRVFFSAAQDIEETGSDQRSQELLILDLSEKEVKNV